jgi:hypothetical protein
VTPSTADVSPVAVAAPTYVPADWAPADDACEPGRDVALDLVRGLAIVILVVNHIHLESVLEYATSALLSAAEVLVSVSGVVVGMVFGRRWLTDGARATTAMLLRRSRKLYTASVIVVALVGTLTFVPGLATEAVTVSPDMQPAQDLYAFDGTPRTLWAIVTLEAGPWQFNILGFFIAALAAAPAVLWALARGGWPVVLVASWAVFVIGREWQLDVLPAQSERPFPILVWQLLFVHGLLLGWHRERIARALRDARRLVAGAIITVALVAATVVLIGPAIVGATDWARWEDEHFDKGSLDLARLVAMVSLTAAIYLTFRRYASVGQHAVGWLLLPLGRNSFYVFIMHVFVCLAIASVPALAGDGLGLIGNTIVQAGCVALLWTMVRHRVLFRWVPR